jgi:hypothetical protein
MKNWLLKFKLNQLPKFTPNDMTFVIFFMLIGALLGLYLNLVFVNLIIFLVVIWVILRPTSSWQLARISLTFFIFTVASLVLKKTDYVEQFSVGVYIFFLLSVITTILEARRK